MKSNIKKSKQLGIPWGTANNKLKKKILFNLLCKLNENVCFHCNKKITSENELSVEHKEPWLDNSPSLFWDLDNIAFSHLSCNCSNGRKAIKGKISPHGTKERYCYSECRCDLCRKANTEDMRYRRRKHNKKYN